MKPTDTNTARPLRDVVGAVAHTLQRLPPGDLAALRRLSPDDPHCPALWKLLVGDLADQLPTDDASRRRAERRWAVILAAMTNGLVGPGRRFGRALGEAVPETRVVKMLRAHDDALAVAVRTVVQQLASRGVYFDPFDLARLVLTDGTDAEDDVRRHIYEDFFTVAQSA